MSKVKAMQLPVALKGINCGEGPVCCTGLSAVLMRSQLPADSEHVWCVHCIPDTVQTSLFCETPELSENKARAGFGPPKAVKTCLCRCCLLRGKCYALTLPHTGDTTLKTTLRLGERRRNSCFFATRSAGFQDFLLRLHGGGTFFPVASF